MKLLNVLFIGIQLFPGFLNSSIPKNNPQKPIILGDPYILVDNGTYYMYGTGKRSDIGIEVYKSDNLKEWKGGGFALHEDDVYGKNKFWAPEVYKVGSAYYMFFSVEEHMAIATSDSPMGPFTQESPSVLRDHKSIDHHLFIDDDGTKYLYFANFKDGLEIWGAELNDDFSSIKEETLTKLLSPSQDWERSTKDPVGVVNEGPYVLKKEDKYYMTYSANHYASPDYGICLAFANQPLKAWTKSEKNPIMQNPDSLVGTGHSAFFRDKEGQLYISYHAHNGKAEVHPRKAYINEIKFTEPENAAYYQLKILPPRIAPIEIPG